MKVISFHISKNSLISLFLCFWLSVPLWGVAQKEANHWYFGKGAGLDFSNEKPIVDTNSILFSGNAFSVCSDKNGNLLFYTDGTTVINKEYKVMSNGDTLRTEIIGMDASLIIPAPANNNLFYIFVPYLHAYKSYFVYHLVDMSKQNGLGEVVSKNIRLLDSTSYRITAVRCSDNLSVWIIVHGQFNNKFYSYKLSSTGLDPNPVVSTIGTVNSTIFYQGFGQMKVSANGKKIAVANTDWILKKYFVEIFDFDSKTGMISNPIKITNVIGPYGVGFSPNNKLLYVAENVGGATGSIISQFNLEFVSVSSISQSKTIIGYPWYYSGSLQEGNDGRLYIGVGGWPYMDVINYPNIIGLDCEYEDSAIYLGGRYNSLGLPTFLQSYFFLPDFKYQNQCYGDTTFFSISDTSRVDSVWWNFGDSKSGLKNIGKGFYPFHIYSDTGIFNVSMIVFKDNITDTFSREIQIDHTPVAAFTFNKDNQCLNGNLYKFNNLSTCPNRLLTYDWRFGDSLADFHTNPEHTYSFADTFRVSLVAISEIGCTDTAFKQLIVKDEPKAKPIFSDTALCFNSHVISFTDSTKTIDSNFNRIWYFGNGDSTLLAKTNYSYPAFGSYTSKLIVGYPNGCVDTAIQTIYVYENPAVSFVVNDSVQCFKGNKFITSNQTIFNSGSLIWKWNFGDSGISVLKNPVHYYKNPDSFTTSLSAISDMGCSDSFSMNLLVNPSPIANYTVNKTPQCRKWNRFDFKNTSTISGGYIDSIYWAFGDSASAVGDSVSHSYSGTMSYNFIQYVFSDQGCIDSFSDVVNVIPSPKPDFSLNADHQCFMNNNFIFTNQTKIDYGKLSFYWDFGDKSSSILKNTSHQYLKTDSFLVKLIANSELNCSDTISKMIYVHAEPKADFSINTPNQCFNEQIYSFINQAIVQSGSTEYFWVLDNYSIQNKDIQDFKFSKFGNFPVKLLAINDLICKDSITKQVIVFSNPVNSYSLNDTTQCFNGNLFNFNNLSTSSDGQKISTFWDLEEITSTLKNFNYSFLTVGTKNITLISKTDSGCYDTSAFQINIFPSPKADFSINDSDQCFNEQNFVITNKSAVGSGQLANVWHINGDTFSTIDLLINDLQPATCNLKLVTTTENDCSDSIEKQLIVHSSPFAQFAVNDSTQCLDSNSFNFTNLSTISNGTMTYNWIIDSLNFPTFEPSNLHLNTWGKYSIKLIATSDKSCTDTTESSVYVFPNPVSAFIFLNNCHEDTMWFFDKSYSDSGSIQQWYWDFKNGKTSTLKNPFTVFYDSGQKAVTLVSTNNFGCSHDTTRFFKIETHVTAPELERASVENDEFVLIEWNPPTDGIPMTYHLEKSTDSILWNLLSDFDNKTFNYNDLQTKVDLRNYYYRLNVTDSCQFTSPYSNIGKTILLTIDTSQQFPVLIWTPYELWTSGVAGYELQVTGCELQVSGSNDFQTVIEIPKSAIINPKSAISQSDSLTKLSSPTYCYRVLATRNGDGLQSVSNVVCTPTPFRLFIPNAFTPNNDGVNDIFMPLGMYILDYNLQIFSRWGELIFESNNIKQGWDGTYKGRVCQVDEYFYQISANGTGSQGKTVVGTVMLLR